MRVLHYEHNGVGVVLSKELNRMGIKSTVISQAKHPFGFEADCVIPKYFPSIRPWIVARISPFLNILHSHDGSPLHHSIMDAYHKKIIQHYHGPLQHDFYPGKNVPSFVASPLMEQMIPNSKWLPLPVDRSLFYPIKRSPKNEIVIGYSYNKNADPSKLALMPVAELQAFAESNNRVQLFPLTETLPYTMMPDYYRQLDIYVDRIGLDSYGWQAVEAAACGVWVISQYKGYPSDCPFVSLGESINLSNVLFLWTSDSRVNISNEHVMDYIAKYHDSRVVARQCLEKYKEMLDA